MTFSARAAEVDRSAVYHARDSDEAFKAAWADAIDQAGDVLEAEARRRAVEGWEEPVFGSGGTGVGTVEVGTIRRYSNALLIFLLKGARPEKYRERYDLRHGGEIKNPVILYLPHNGRDQTAAGSAGSVPGNAG